MNPLVHAVPTTHRSRARRRGGRRALLGLALVVASWSLNWGLDGLRTHLLFFPLWLGYVVALDGVVERRTGTSPWSRSPRELVTTFLVSIPVWWIFELFNLRLGNWEYVGREHFSDFQYFVLCSLSFSTVMPAVFVTAELVRSMGWVERFAERRAVRATRRLENGLFVAGVLSLGALCLWPRVFFPLLWVGGVLVLEPICRRLRRPSLLDDLERGDWRPWVSLWGGVLVCGFFWEMWNAWSYPRWIYDVPGVDFLYVFEMPLLGYLGYLPFALELYLLRSLAQPGARSPRLGPREPVSTAA